MKSKQHFCAGTLIHPQWILTAAHCFTFIKLPQDVLIFPRMTGSNSSLTASKIYIHQGYNPTVIIHDIALIRMKEPFRYQEQNYLIQLPKAFNKEPNTFEDLNVLLLGWGLEKTGGHLSLNLQQVHLKTLNLELCRQRLNAFLHPTNICASADGKGQCSGDSGGPLIYNQTQIAIVSWSLKPCASTPGVLTLVNHYIEWIDEILTTND